MSEKGILEWLGKRKEESVNAGARTHIVAVLNAVSELEQIIGSMVGGNGDSAQKGIERLVISEREADSIQDRLSAEIGRSDLTVEERGHLLFFIKQIDSIADWAKEAALHVQLIIDTGAGVPNHIWMTIDSTVKDLYEEIRLLVSAVEMYTVDPKGTMRTIDSINDLERIIDFKYYDSIKQVHLSGMDVKAVLLITEVIKFVEMVADGGKECSDTINALIVSRGLYQ